MEPSYYEISPGFGAFVATFLVAVALILLCYSMIRHFRKIQHGPDAATEAEHGINHDDVASDVKPKIQP